MVKRVRNFCITINNPRSQDGKLLKKMENVRYGIIGVEVGESGTPHIQGYIQLEKPRTIKSFQKSLKKVGIKCHIEIAKGGLEANKKYCSKDGKFKEWGEAKTQGSRTDLTEMYQMIKEGKSNQEIREDMPNTYMKYYKAVDRVKLELEQEKGLKAVQDSMKNARMKEWQTEVLDRLDKQTDRKITWVYDEKGNNGKTWLAKWLIANKGAYYVQGGKSADIAYAYKNEEYVIFDFTRSQEERVNYSVVESFKNGLLFSPKYESQMKLFKSAKVLCLSNFEPDQHKLSMDRWDILEL